MKQAYDKKVKPLEFREGDLMLRNILSFNSDSKGKWDPNYEGPYVAKKVFSGGALILETMDGEEFPHSVNDDVVKKYFAKRNKKEQLANLKTRKGDVMRWEN